MLLVTHLHMVFTLSPLPSLIHGDFSAPFAVLASMFPFLSPVLLQIPVPDFAGIFQPLLDSLKKAIPVIAGILIIWVIVEEWVRNPGNYNVFSAIWKGIMIGGVAWVLTNAEKFLTGIK